MLSAGDSGVFRANVRFVFYKTLKRRAMRLSDFILLSEEEKRTAVLHQGVLLAKRDSNYCKVFLFGVEDYYVEMFCNMKSRSVEEFRVFDNTGLLTPYLQAISLDGLIE
jgi:hypothetical protein